MRLKPNAHADVPDLDEELKWLEQTVVNPADPEHQAKLDKIRAAMQNEGGDASNTELENMRAVWRTRKKSLGL